MPDGLREAHHHLDLAVERCYRSKPFASDEERLEYLFKLYEDMTAKENQENYCNVYFGNLLKELTVKDRTINGAS